MRPELLIVALTLGICSSAKLPEITTYAKVTKNGEETNKTNNQGNSALSWIINAFSTPNTTKSDIIEGRSSPDISITVSPVYVPPKVPELHNGEAVDYPPTKSYSTLDKEMLSILDAQKSRKQSAKDRFHPPAIFEHDVAHANAAKARLKQIPSSSGPSGPPTAPSQDSPSPQAGPPSTGPGYSSPVFPGSYDYKPPSFLNAKPMTVDGYSSPDSIPKAPSSFDSSSISFGSSPPSDGYSPPADYPSHDHDHDHDHDHEVVDFDPELTHQIHDSEYGSKPVYTPPKAIEYAGHFDHPAYVDDPYIHDHYPHHHDDIIYDHIPDDHTMAPEQMDKRLNKRPYSYYFIGKKLWYIPLYFSIYFIFYIAALILKSISRHKINFPANLHDAVSSSSRNFQNNINDNHGGPGWIDLTFKVLDGIEKFRKKFADKKS